MFSLRVGVPPDSRFRGLHRGALGTVVGAIPPVAVVKDLVFPRPTLELDDKNRLYLRPAACRRSRVNRLDGHTFRKEVELIHRRNGILTGLSGVSLDMGRHLFRRVSVSR